MQTLCRSAVGASRNGGNMASSQETRGGLWQRTYFEALLDIQTILQENPLDPRSG